MIAVVSDCVGFSFKTNWAGFSVRRLLRSGHDTLTYYTLIIVLQDLTYYSLLRLTMCYKFNKDRRAAICIVLLEVVTSVELECSSLLHLSGWIVCYVVVFVL